MARLPFVTIGVCTRNNEETIREVLSSLLDLDYPRGFIEIVVVDGLSRDHTLEMVQHSLTNAKMSYMILSDRGLGLDYARQMIVENANGEFIAFVDGISL